MISNKKIKLSDTSFIQFCFDDNYITIQIYDNNISVSVIRDHDDFTNILADLKSNLHLSNTNIKKINYWFYKNYKKIHPQSEYTTRYGRKINSTLDH
jgi:hypothetical protein